MKSDRKIILTILFSIVGIKISAYDAIINGIYYNIDGAKAIVTYKTDPSAKWGQGVDDYEGVVVIPEYIKWNGRIYDVVEIDRYAFAWCTGLTSVEIPNGIKRISHMAFADCSRLNSVNIPNSVVYIGISAFEDCSRLSTIEIPTSVEYVGGNAFKGTPWLNNQSGLVYINNVLYKCVSLEGDGITIKNGEVNVTIKYGTKRISDYAFSQEYRMNSIHIPSSVKTIGKSAFESCFRLTTIDIPNSVTEINYYAFLHCSGLTSVTIGSGVTKMEYGVFNYCSGLKKIISYIKEPFEIDSWTDVPRYIPLYVPAGTIEKYRNTDGWNYFTNIFEIGTDPDGIENPTIDSSSRSVKNLYYKLDGQRLIEKPTKAGLYIHNEKKIMIQSSVMQ